MNKQDAAAIEPDEDWQKHEAVLREAARLIGEADAIWIGTGAGMGVASGLGTLYLSLPIHNIVILVRLETEQQLPFSKSWQECRGVAALAAAWHWFLWDVHPLLVWQGSCIWLVLLALQVCWHTCIFDFFSSPLVHFTTLAIIIHKIINDLPYYNNRYTAYNSALPHRGYHILRDICAEKPLGGFSFMSNIDGHWLRCGFPADRVIEVHGSVNHMQCHGNCTEDDNSHLASWSSGHQRLDDQHRDQSSHQRPAHVRELWQRISTAERAHVWRLWMGRPQESQAGQTLQEVEEGSHQLPKC